MKFQLCQSHSVDCFKSWDLRETHDSTWIQCLISNMTSVTPPLLPLASVLAQLTGQHFITISVFLFSPLFLLSFFVLSIKNICIIFLLPPSPHPLSLSSSFLRASSHKLYIKESSSSIRDVCPALLPPPLWLLDWQIPKKKKKKISVFMPLPGRMYFCLV